MKKIGVIDPFIVTPAVASFNRLVEVFDAKFSYHAPHLQGLSTLSTTESDGYIVLGSASHVFEKLPWHAPLAEFLITALNQGKPVLGICFGHQLLCHAFGGQVGFYSPDETKLTGPRKVEFVADAYGIAKGFVGHYMVSHRQVVTKISSDLIELARGVSPEVLPFDFVRHRTLPFLGTQPHVEAATLEHFTESVNEPRSISKEAAEKTDGFQMIKAFLKHHQLIQASP